MQRTVSALHADAAVALHDRRQILELPGAQGRAHGGVDDQHFRQRHPALAVRAVDQRLRNHRPQAASQPRTQPRAFVQLVACGSTGMETPQASVEVFLGSKKVAPMGVLRRSRWQGCLPPGEYRVVVRAEGADAADAATREHRVFVQRQNLWLRLRP